MSRGQHWYLGETYEEHIERVRREKKAQRAARNKAIAAEAAETLACAVGLTALFVLTVPFLLLI